MQPTQPAPASGGRGTPQALPNPGGTDPGGGDPGGATEEPNTQSCVTALEAAAAQNCTEARKHAALCGTDQQAEIVRNVETACQGR